MPVHHARPRHKTAFPPVAHHNTTDDANDRKHILPQKEQFAQGCLFLAIEISGRIKPQHADPAMESNVFIGKETTAVEGEGVEIGKVGVDSQKGQGKCSLFGGRTEGEKLA